MGHELGMARNAPGTPNNSDRRPAAQRGDEDPRKMDEAMRKETQDSWAAPSVGVVTPAQVKGGIAGGVIGAVAGGIIGIAIGLLPLFDMAVGLRVLVIGSTGAVAGSTIVGLLGGFFRPDQEGETDALPGEGPRDLGRRRSGHAE